jgi:hypothetical protein
MSLLGYPDHPVFAHVNPKNLLDNGSEALTARFLRAFAERTRVVMIQQLDGRYPHGGSVAEKPAGIEVASSIPNPKRPLFIRWKVWEGPGSYLSHGSRS